MSATALGLGIGIPAALGIMVFIGWRFTQELGESNHAFEYKAGPTITDEMYEHMRNGNYVATEPWHSADRPVHKPPPEPVRKPSEKWNGEWEDTVVDMDYGAGRRRKSKKKHRNKSRKSKSKSKSKAKNHAKTL